MNRLLLTAALVAISPTAYAQSFNCTKAVTQAEHLICANPATLGALDSTMTNLYRDVIASNPTRANGIRRDQIAWWQVRQSCTSAGCVEATERDRIAQLTALSITASAPLDATAFQAGQTDRNAWETWFNGLTGDAHAGAEFWAGQRSQPHPGSCNTYGYSGDWTSGCVSAQRRLAASDARRRSEPDYKLGWNDPGTVTASQPDSDISPITRAMFPNSQPQPLPIPVSAVPASGGAPSWEQIAGRVKAKCANDWPDNYSMQASCLERQKAGFDKIHPNADIVPVAARPQADTEPQPAPPAARPLPPPPAAETSGTGIPQDEQRLLDIVGDAQRQFANGLNDMAKGAARPARGMALCQAFHGLTVRNWVGTVYSLDTNGDGKGVIEITIGENVYIKTWNNALSDISDNTLLDPSSRLYATAVNLHKGQTIRFSGSFFSSSGDCFEESSVSLAGSLTEPEYIFRFSAISE